jgi:hypothetical protein
MMQEENDLEEIPVNEEEEEEKESIPIIVKKTNPEAEEIQPISWREGKTFINFWT